MSSTSQQPTGSPARSLTIRPSSTASLGGLPLYSLPRSIPASASFPAPVPAPEQTPVPPPATVVGTSFVLSSSRSPHLQLLSPEAIARHAFGSPVIPVRGPPRLAEGFIPFPAPAPSPADDPRVVFANTTPDTHRTPALSNEAEARSHFTYTSSSFVRGNSTDVDSGTPAAKRGTGALSTIQEDCTSRSYSPTPSVASAPPALSPLSRQSSISKSEASVSGSVTSGTSSAATGRTNVSGTRSTSSQSSQRSWEPSRTRGRSVDHSLRFVDFKSWSVRSEDFGQSRSDTRRLDGTGADAASSTSGSGTTGPRPEPVRERGEEDDFGRELDELESVVSDMSEKLATLHFVGRGTIETGDDEVLSDKGKGRERGDVRRERRDARRLADLLPASPTKSANRPPNSRRTSSSAGSAVSAVSGRNVRAGPVPPLVFSAS